MDVDTRQAQSALFRLGQDEVEGIVLEARRNRRLDEADTGRAAGLDEAGLAGLVAEGLEGLAHIGRAVTVGNGILLVIPPLGNPGLMAAFLAARGAPVSAPRTPSSFGWGDASTVLGVWARHGVRAAEPTDAGGMAAILKSGELLMLPAIHGPPGEGTWVPFFGQPVNIWMLPARLARETGAVLLPGTLVRAADDRYRLMILPPIRTVQSGDLIWNDWENTRRTLTAVQAILERNPGHAHWDHPLPWGTPPEAWSAPRPPDRDPLYGIRSPREGPP